MVTLERCLASVSSSLLLALAGWCAGCADEDFRAPRIEPSSEGVDTVGFGLSFIVADTETACGRAAGIRIVIANGDAQESCEAGWAAASIDGPGTSGGGHHVADCLFVVAAGTWTIASIDVIGDDGAPLACCSSRYVARIEVTEAETTEVAAELVCDAPGNGAIDIYGWLDRPPIIVALAMTPTKFVPGCTPVSLAATAADPDGDPIWYAWEVIDAPAAPETWSLSWVGDRATFLATVAGTYQLRLTVVEPVHDLQATLVFPIHVVTSDATCLEPPDPPHTSCVKTQGYWKNHEAYWPLASVTLGARVYTKAEALTLLRTAPRGDASIILAHQLIAAKLNIAAGADSRRADDLVFAADELLTRNPVGSHVTGEVAQAMTALAEELTAFNEGRLCGPDRVDPDRAGTSRSECGVCAPEP